MADKKISALTAATTPVAGSEVLPIVQSGSTVKVSIDNLTTGKVTPTNGVKFPATQVASADANTLDDYEEGTWTPVIAGSTTAGTASYSLQTASYTKVGRLVFIYGIVGWSSGTGTGNLKITGLPFSTANGSFIGVNFVNDLSYSLNTTVSLEVSGTSLNFKETPIGVGAAGVSTGSVAYDVAAIVQFSGCYSV